VHDFGVEAEIRAFLVMELLEGSSLREELRRLKRIEPSATVRILSAVCSAVDAAHSRQLIHRDLKPENIFLVKDPGGGGSSGNVKVLDFGIAKSISVPPKSLRLKFPLIDTGPGILVGTVAYMSPEQLTGEPVSACWDLWALSVVAYEMLTAPHRFARTPEETGHARFWRGVSPPSINTCSCPAGWQEFFSRAFAVSAAARPSRPALSSKSWKRLILSRMARSSIPT